MVLIQDHNSGDIIYSKNPRKIGPIASITKLMMAMVVIDSCADRQELLAINGSDSRNKSCIEVGSRLSRSELLCLALMASENLAASVLAKHYPGGKTAFVQAMNTKALSLGMKNTRFVDSTGLKPANVSSPKELLLMLNAAADYPLIRKMTTTSSVIQHFNDSNVRVFKNTNVLVNNPDWHIELSKTGYIPKAGKCLVMRALINKRMTNIVLLNSAKGLMRFVDAITIKQLLEPDFCNYRLLVN